MTWKPGESGNPEGRALNKPFLDAVNRAIAQDDGKRLRAAAEKLLDSASTGEPWALQMIADRLDGKPKQQTELTGAEGGPIQMQAVELAIIDPHDHKG